MNNRFSQEDFLREEELFKRFLENKRLGSEPAEEAVPSDKPQDENPAGTFDPTGLTIDDILPPSPKDTAAPKGFFNKIRFYLAYYFSEKNIRRISCLVIPGFLLLMLVLNIITPSKDISQKENRALAGFPKISLSSIKDGSFSKGFEDYIADQFIFRNSFVAAKRHFETLLGKKENHGILFGKDGYLIQNAADLSFENVTPNVKAIHDLAAVKRYNLTLAVVPGAYEVMNNKLPRNAYTNVYGHLNKTLAKSIKADNIRLADTLPVLKENRDKYIYYRSDHHQTALGSYYLYSSLGESLAYQPYSLDSFDTKDMSKDFIGTTWSNSGFASTKADTITRYTLKQGFDYTVSFPTENKTMNTLYSDKMLDTKDKYSYYLDGNHGLAEITSTCGGDRRIAIIKDSYAHSLVPFLANHYSKIFMIDLRYYNGDIFEYLYKSDIKDVLVLYNMNTFLTDNNLSKISAFAASSSYTSVPDINYGIVPELQKVDSSYFDDAVFVGDSLTLGLNYFSGFNSEFLCMGGLSTKNLETEPLADGRTVLEAIAAREHVGKVYIMLGTNESIYNKPQEFIARYSAFIDKVREYHPHAVVYIQSIMPVSAIYSDTHDLKNYLIADHNKYLLQLAKDKQCYYIDVNSFFAGADGFLPEDAGGDGVHLSPENYRLMADFLKTRAVNVGGVKKIGPQKTNIFKGGKLDTGAIAAQIVSGIEFKDTLSRVSDSLVVSNYKLDTGKVLSAALYVSGGSTAEEVAVFELKSSKDAPELIRCIKQRIESKKKDFENYIPAEMAKLSSPYIVRKDNVVVLCLADKADEDVIKGFIR